MSKKLRPNEPCPCQSGRKYKKCCGGPNSKTAMVGLPHTRADRTSAFEKLDFFINELYEDEGEEAFGEFWGRRLEHEDELSEGLLAMSNDVQDMWFAFDCELDDGSYVIDEFLVQAQLNGGERSFLTAMRKSSMHLYEVTEVVPGTSLTLRDLVEGDVVTVHERSGSRTLVRHDCLAARILPRGCSGQPEVERGLLPIPSLLREEVLEQVTGLRNEYLTENLGAPLDGFYKQLPPFFHGIWISSIFEPQVPRLSNTDGEEVVITRVSFHAKAVDKLRAALASAEHEGLRPEGNDVWSWSGKNSSGEDTTLGRLELRKGLLMLEANSVERGNRGRALVERLAGVAVLHRSTTHEDLRSKVVEEVTARALGQELPDTGVGPTSAALDPDVAEALVMDQYARHYRAWVDEPVPALDDQTPRIAAGNSTLRPRVEELIRKLESMYERALKDGQPAYDPSWMWSELGLRSEPNPSAPPPLAHERVAERVPGSAEASRACAEKARAMPSFSDQSTTLDEDDLQRDLELQRFLRRNRPSANDAEQEGSVAAPYIALMVNFDLHRRKVFWVDEALSFMLENTDLDVVGRELHTPFANFAFVFTDRHTLALGERLLSRHTDDPLCGHILHVATVYISERHGESGRLLEIVYAFDALGADLPSLVRYTVPARDDASLKAYLNSVAPSFSTEPKVRDTSPARSLLRLVVNAILYASSAGVTPEVRTVVRSKRTLSSPEPPPSDSVFFLPGNIDIRQVRQLRQLRRTGEGGRLFARFMVRGHWRRPAKNWTEQQLRWIAPYWKGPDMAAIIEKAYRLKA